MLYVSDSLIAIAKSKKRAQIDMWHVHFRLNVSLHYLSHLSWQVYWHPKYHVAESSIFSSTFLYPPNFNIKNILSLLTWCETVDQELKWNSTKSFHPLWGCPEVTLGPPSSDSAFTYPSPRCLAAATTSKPKYREALRNEWASLCPKFRMPLTKNWKKQFLALP